MSVVVGGEVAPGAADVPVVPEAGGERQQALRDAGDEAGHYNLSAKRFAWTYTGKVLAA